MKKQVISGGFLLLIIFLSGCMGSRATVKDLVHWAEVDVGILIQNVSVFDGISERIIENQDIYIVKGEIFSLGKSGTLQIQGSPKIIDGNGKFLMPGLVDSHVHLASSGAAPWASVKPNVKYNLEAYLYSGITTVYELGGQAPQTEKFSKKTELGKWEGPQIFFTHTPITVPGSHPIPLAEAIAPWPLNKRIKKLVPTLEEKGDAAEIIAKYEKKGVHYIKVMCDQMPPGSPEMSEKLMRDLVEAAHAKGFKVFVHIGSPENALTAIRAGADVLAHGIWRGQLTEAQAREIAESGIPIIYTLAGFENVHQINQGQFEPSETDRLLIPPEVLEPISGGNGKGFQNTEVLHEFAGDVSQKRGFWRANFELLRKSGANILVGTDSALPGTYPGATYIQELNLLLEYGMNRFEVLRAATSGNAKLFLENPDFGSIKAGNRADLLLLSENPMDNLDAVRNLELIIAQGRIVTRN